MKMTFRWYGSFMDPIPLKYIRQIPGITGVVTSLMDLPAGELWPLDRLKELKKEVNGSGLELEVIESVNIHEDIKLGLPSREQYIENYKETIRNLGKIGVKVICYNFMPVFDWTRTSLDRVLPDGSNTMSYDQDIIDKITDPQKFADEIQNQTGEFEMAGWEPERMTELKRLFKAYETVSHEKLKENLKYFLKAVIPVCEECDIRMAMHPDDPPWDIFGLPRIAHSLKAYEEIISMVDSPYNCITLCTGSLGSDPDNHLPEIIRHFGRKNRIAFVHARNLKIEEPGKFYESSHLSEDGSFDMYEIMKALNEVGYDGYIRPDHGRMIWGERGRAGYGLFDRALGIAYLNGIQESIEKQKGNIYVGIENVTA
ncbi:MAG: mannonate dehydratase [Dorea sp.]|jgi:mannonate dehydratase|nr:mannonate dehydratase [Dorea sp.]